MDIDIPSPAEAARKISGLVGWMMDFWKDAHGWAPTEAASLLSKSMLEWQKSLAASLSKWTGALTDGELILAWANVGAVVEGQLKLFLSIYYADYSRNLDSAVKDKNGKLKDPDGLMLEPLRQFFRKNIWTDGDTWDVWILLVQSRRNAIHAFEAKTIGNAAELHETIRTLLAFVRMINSRLPYPDDVYIPTER
jgi:hypothetical protein